MTADSLRDRVFTSDEHAEADAEEELEVLAGIRAAAKAGHPATPQTIGDYFKTDPEFYEPAIARLSAKGRVRVLPDGTVQWPDTGAAAFPVVPHTPGPWRQNEHTVYYINPKIESGEMSHFEPDPRHIASTTAVDAAAWSSGVPEEESIANARLIAAAPALLEACRALVGLNGHASLNPMRQAMEAIDLATGVKP